MVKLEELREAIRCMTRKQSIYLVLRDELTKLGYWRKKPRGNPKLGYLKMKDKLEQR